MARNGNHGKDTPVRRQAVAKGQSDVIWVNYTLNEREKAQLEELTAASPDAMLGEMQKAALEGYRWTISHDSYAGCWAVTMYTRNEQDINHGLMMSSRSMDWFKALMMCVFKHVIIFEERWDGGTPEPRSFEG